MDDNKNLNMPEPELTEETSDALESFLSRENEPADKTTKGKPKNRLWLFIAAGVVVVLVGVLLAVNLIPSSSSDEEQTEAQPAQITVSVDDKGEHQAEVAIEKKTGEPEQNGSGTLVSYNVADIVRIDVENPSGSFSVLSETPVVTNEDGEEETDTTVYTLVGFEDYELQDGQADAVANDASVVGFSSIADTKGNLADFGLDKPRATVSITYSDDTTSIVRIGNDAVSELGVYIAFGDADTVYLAASESVDSFLYSVLDLISRDITPSGEEDGTAKPLKAWISGSHYRDEIVLEQNEDEALNSEYLVTAPVKMPADAVESANVVGAIRGLYADEVVCVNPSDSQLEGYGLKKPYAAVKAKFTDETIVLRASAPSDEGKVYLLNPDKKIVYSVELGTVEWVNTSVNKLTPDTVLDVKKTAVSRIVYEADGKTYDITAQTKTESVDTDEGETEDVTVTYAYYNDEQLDTDNYSIFFQNLNAIKLVAQEDDKYSGKGYTIRISYNTGRDDDVIVFTPGSGNTLLATVNGDDMGCVYKNYIRRLTGCIEDLVIGRDVVSF